MKYFILTVKQIDTEVFTKDCDEKGTLDEAQISFARSYADALEDITVKSVFCLLMDGHGAPIERKYWKREIPTVLPTE